MARKYPPEFKRDLVTVARRGDRSVAQVAIDFGIAEEDCAALDAPGRCR
jgi:transposase-like protein